MTETKATIETVHTVLRLDIEPGLSRIGISTTIPRALKVWELRSGNVGPIRVDLVEADGMAYTDEAGKEAAETWCPTAPGSEDGLYNGLCAHAFLRIEGALDKPTPEGAYVELDLIDVKLPPGAEVQLLLDSLQRLGGPGVDSIPVRSICDRIRALGGVVPDVPVTVIASPNGGRNAPPPVAPPVNKPLAPPPAMPRIRPRAPGSPGSGLTPDAMRAHASVSNERTGAMANENGNGHGDGDAILDDRVFLRTIAANAVAGLMPQAQQYNLSPADVAQRAWHVALAVHATEREHTAPAPAAHGQQNPRSLPR